jgi:hypothetical protein
LGVEFPSTSIDHPFRAVITEEASMAEVVTVVRTTVAEATDTVTVIATDTVAGKQPDLY